MPCLFPHSVNYNRAAFELDTQHPVPLWNRGSRLWHHPRTITHTSGTSDCGTNAKQSTDRTPPTFLLPGAFSSSGF